MRRACRDGCRDRLGAGRAARPAALPLPVLRCRAARQGCHSWSLLAPGRAGLARRQRCRRRSRLSGSRPSGRRLAAAQRPSIRDGRASRALPADGAHRPVPSGSRRARHAAALAQRQGLRASDVPPRALRRRPRAARPGLSLSGRGEPRPYGRRTARRGPARKPAPISSGIAMLSATGTPSKRSTASRLAPPART